MHDVTISQGDLKIRANKASVVGGLNYQNSKWTISGDVRINAQGGSLQSDEAVVTFANNLITRATVTGAPAQFEAAARSTARNRRAATRAPSTTKRRRGNVSLKDEGLAVRRLQRDPQRADGVQHPLAERAGAVGGAGGRRQQ